MGSLLERFRKPPAVGSSERHTCTMYGTHGVVEHKMELTYVKLGAVYYGMCSAHRM